MKDVFSQMGRIINPLQVKLDQKGFKTTLKKKDLDRLKIKYPNP